MATWAKTGLSEKSHKSHELLSFSSLVLFLEFLSLTRNMNAQVRNRCEFSSYLDIKNTKKIFFKRDFVTQTYDFTSRQDSTFSAAVSEWIGE